MLRYQPEIGPGLDAPLARYLSLPVVPTQLGFDPRLQLLHAEDATGALLAATMNPIRGAVNVAPSGSISLSRALRLIGRPQLPAPAPALRPGDGAARRAASAPAASTATRSACCATAAASTTRRLRTELGYEPRFDAVAAIRDFAAAERRPAARAGCRGVGSVLDRLAGAPR